MLVQNYTRFLTDKMRMQTIQLESPISETLQSLAGKPSFIAPWRRNVNAVHTFSMSDYNKVLVERWF